MQKVTVQGLLLLAVVAFVQAVLVPLAASAAVVTAVAGFAVQKVIA